MKRSLQSLLVVVLIVVCIVSGIFVVRNIRTTVDGVITEKFWYRAINVESYQPRNIQDWCSQKPADAYNVVVSSKKSGTFSIPIGKNVPSVKVPIFSDWCDYTVDRWETSRAVETMGLYDLEPYWGIPDTVPNCNKIGCTRENGRVELYQLKLKTTGEKPVEIKCIVSESVYTDFNLKDSATIWVFWLDHSPDCSTIS